MRTRRQTVSTRADLGVGTTRGGAVDREISADDKNLFPRHARGRRKTLRAQVVFELERRRGYSAMTRPRPCSGAQVVYRVVAN